MNKITKSRYTLIGLFTLMLAGLIVALNPSYNTKVYRLYAVRTDYLVRKFAERVLDLPVPLNYIKKDILADKIKHPAEWAVQQVRSDFANYNDASKQNVLATYNALEPENWVVMFEIVDGKVTVERKIHRMSGTEERGLEIYTRLVEYLAAQGYVRNVSFLLRLSDFFPDIDQFQGVNAAPILTMAKDLNKSFERNLILIPDYKNLEEIAKLSPRILHANKTFPWAKKQDKILWRGGNADISGFRQALVKYSREHPESIIDAKFVVEARDKNAIHPELQVRAKYLLTIDGRTAAWTRPTWQLLSNSVMLKQESPLIQWYYTAIQPDVHYIAVNNDPSNLEPTIAKYTDQQLQTIALNGTQFAEQNLTINDMAAYLAMVLQTYEGLQQQNVSN